MHPLSVMVVDDDKLLRHGLQRILESAGDITVPVVCGGDEAVELAVRHRPGIALVDIHMGDIDGIDVLKALRALDEPPVVAMLTGFGTDENVSRALAAGAAGFFLKDAAVRELIPGVRLLAAGGSALSSRVARSMARAPASDAAFAGAPLSSLADAPLTDREREVLSLLSAGLTNGEIAGRLTLSVATIKDHVSSVLGKLGAANRIQAAVLAHTRPAGRGGGEPR
ncbi:response regulator [Streptomyces sp. NPDC059567]|uniref:response regulator n=1 Tax=Streptomyces sp. NPDC059567 TaxID=3346867 RepID=UPI0036CF0036